MFDFKVCIDRNNSLVLTIKKTRDLISVRPSKVNQQEVILTCYLNHCSVRFGIFVTDIRSCATELELLVPIYSTEKPSKGKSRTKNRK